MAITGLQVISYKLQGTPSRGIVLLSPLCIIIIPLVELIAPCTWGLVKV